MAAVVSPSPVPSIPTYSDIAFRRPSSRNAIRPNRRPYANRPSPHAALLNKFASSARNAGGDSSDDEDLAPIKLSAEAQAILGEENSQISSSGKRSATPREFQTDADEPRRSIGLSSGRLHRSSLSPDRDKGSPAPRVVKIAAPSRPAALSIQARDGSFMYKTVDKTSDSYQRSLYGSKTPASNLRSVRVSGSRSQTRSPPSTLSNGRGACSNSASDNSSGSRQNGSPANRNSTSPGDGSLAAGPSTVTRPRKTDENGVQSTMRIKRIGAGTFLNGPVRRGMIRRQSDEDDIPVHDDEDANGASPEMQVGRRAAEVDLDDRPDDILLDQYSPLARYKEGLQPKAPTPPISALSLAAKNLQQDLEMPSRSTSPPGSSSYHKQDRPSAGRNSGPTAKSSGSSSKARFHLPSLPPLPSAHDQENDPPPTFKRNKPTSTVLGDLESLDQAMPAKLPDIANASSGSLQRKPLAPRSQNTPHRPAPAPPPKMSMLEAATSVTGSSRSKKTIHITINGKEYRRLDCIGRGGSSRVYRIMAENYKIFALKRVNLEDADMAAIAGYKGEIDLLKKLENVDRVIRLFDFEVKEDKGILNVMMELGESDFNKMLNEQLKTENAKLDVTFTRHYWKEMLECVQAVHDHGIVHSDLKPANFLLVKGQLKLIDFGIANAIQDNTVNVHRENQIGTPNYMSPESLVCHTPAVGAPPGAKLLKLGKPSDVWSLGCILYQMTYGQPPFAHITKPFERIMSIPNPKVQIQFPNTGVGGVVVPFGLIKTLRRCLQREQSLRPTIQELLNEQDPFLCPVAISPEMLGRVIGNVVGYVRRREEGLREQGVLVGDGSAVPKDEEMKAWPQAFYDRLRLAQEEGTAW